MIDVTFKSKIEIISFQLKLEHGYINLYYANRNEEGREWACGFDLKERDSWFPKLWALLPDMTIAEGHEKAQLANFIIASIELLRLAKES